MRKMWKWLVWFAFLAVLALWYYDYLRPSQFLYWVNVQASRLLRFIGVLE